MSAFAALLLNEMLKAQGARVSSWVTSGRDFTEQQCPLGLMPCPGRG